MCIKYVCMNIFICAIYKNEMLEGKVSENWLNKTISREWSTLQILKSCCIKYLFQWGNTCGIGKNGNVGYEMDMHCGPNFVKCLYLFCGKKLERIQNSSMFWDEFDFLLWALMFSAFFCQQNAINSFLKLG